MIKKNNNQQQQAGSELYVDMDDLIHEKCHNVSVKTNYMRLNNLSQRRRGVKYQNCREVFN